MAYTLGMIGAGNMAEAIARAAIEQGVLSGDDLLASDPSVDRRERLASLGIATTESSAAVVERAEQVMLAVKPQTLDKVASALQTLDTERQVLLSIMAGVPTRRIAEAVGGPPRVVRIMPNTPLLVGEGMSAIALGPHAESDDAALARRIFAAAGEVVEVEETAMDAVTALSGSGPAYLFYVAEAMAEAARSLGLTDEQATKLTEQTLLGSATLLKGSEESAGELRDRVTSPGGTTEAAIRELDRGDVRSAVVRAITSAAERGRELGG